MRSDGKGREADPAAREREAAVLARVRAGETDAFEHFVRAHQRRLYRLVLTLVRNAADADQITQDAFVKAFRAIREFKGDSAFETWLTRIAVNCVRDQARRRKPEMPFADLAPDDPGDGELPRSLEPSDGSSPQRDLESREIRRRVHEALAGLSPRQRAVFVMKHYEERSIAEIGEAIGLDEGTVKSHLFRAARKLRQKLEDLR